MFSWQMGPLQMITLLDYEAIRSLLAADNKVSCCCAISDNRRTLLNIRTAAGAWFWSCCWEATRHKNRTQT